MRRRRRTAHLPMILGDDGAKLSKRHGAVDIRNYRDLGYLPEALLNYLVRLGWSHGDQEVFSLDEMIAAFDIADVNQSASAFNPDKLKWLNEEHMKAADPGSVGERLMPFLEAAGLDPAAGPSPAAVVRAYRERASTLAEMAESCRYCYEEFDDFDASAAKKHLRGVLLEPLTALRDALAVVEDWSGEALTAAVQSVADAHELKFGKLGQPLRVAVTGGGVSPPIDVTLALVGKTRTLARIDRALTYIEARVAAT